METANNQSLIRSLTILGSVVIAAFVALAIWGRDNAIVSTTITPIVTIATLLVTGMFTLKLSSEAKTAALESKAASKANANGISEVHGLVNGQKSALEKRLEDQNKQILDLHTALGRLEAALTTERSRPATGPILSAPVAPVSGPTTIAPGGPTTIAPEGPVTIVLPPDVATAPPGQVGDHL